MIEIISPMIKQFLPFAQKRMGFSQPPKLFLRGDDKNAQNPLGKTAYYDPAQKSITVYVTGRHPKDVMRSISHELVHHAQNCRGEFDKPHQMGDGYAQNDSHMREMEREAYEVGNMCFRDWEDGLKNTIYLEHLQKGEKKMSTKDWKNKEIGTLLSEAWGFKFNSLEEFNEFNGEGELQAEAEHDDELDEGRGDKDKDLDEGRGDKDDDLDEGRGGKAMNRDEDEVKEMKEEEELEEGGAAQRKGDPRVRRQDPDRLREEEELEEELENPKKADLDKDGKLSGYEKKRGKAIEKAMKKDKKPTKEQIEALVKKALREALQKRKG